MTAIGCEPLARASANGSATSVIESALAAGLETLSAPSPAPSGCMRKQYYFRASPRGLLAWDVDRLVALSRSLPVRPVPLAEISSLDEPVFGEGEPPTWRALVAHVQLLQAAELVHPIILAANGDVMDGRHRAARALLERRLTIDAVQFREDPPPDHVGRLPDDLPYESDYL